MSLQSIAQPAQASVGFDRLLRTAGDEQLRNMAQQYKDKDTIAFSLITQEGMRRKEVRDAAQAEMARAQMGGAPTTVADQQIASMTSAPVAPVGNSGIAQLKAPNIARMADGGIAGYGDDANEGGGPASQLAFSNEPVMRMADGGYVARYADTGSVNAPFEDALRTTLRYEGGYVENDAGRGPSKFGINKAANPDVDVKNLTKEQARELYKKRYWDAIGGDSLAAKDPALAKVAFDTAVNMGVGKAKQLVTASKGDPSTLLNMRQEHYDKLIEADPKKFAPYKSGWQSRLADLASSVIPSAEAGQERPAPQVPQGNAGAGLAALGAGAGAGVGASGMSMGPLNSVLRPSSRLGIAAPGMAVPAGVGAVGGALSAGAANALSNATPEQLGQLQGDIGSDTGLAAAIMNPENRRPENAPKMSYADQMANVGKMLVQHPDIDKMREQNAKTTAAAAKQPVKADSSVYDREDMEEGAAKFEAPKVPDKEDILKATKEAVPEETLFGLGKQDIMMLGLQLMASKNPRMLGALGEAGIGTLAAKTAREKAQTEKELTQAHKEYYTAGAAKAKAEADYLASGAKGIGAVQKAADTDYDNWLKAMQANPMLKMQLTPELAAQKRQEFLDKAYKMYKIEPPAGASSAPAAPSSDPLGILSKKG